MQFGSHVIDLTQPQVMGILNVTPDSFSDGGRHKSLQMAIDHGKRMIDEGATFIDVGGESTRPGASPVSIDEELDRVIPVVEALNKSTDSVISVDTSKATVIKEAAKAGAGLINDVRALQQEGALDAAVESKLPVCLMHMQGEPVSMQDNPQYEHVTREVEGFLLSRIAQCMESGISKDAIIVDPGFGFGKTLEHNYALLKQLDYILKMGYPVLVGMSRKSMIGNLLNRKVDERLAGSIALATIACQKGATLFRVHDVKETMDAIKIVQALESVE